MSVTEYQEGIERDLEVSHGGIWEVVGVVGGGNWIGWGLVARYLDTLINIP